MSTPLQPLRETVGKGDPAADLIARLPKTAPIDPNAKARLWAKLQAPQRMRVSVPLSVKLAAAAVLLLASAAFAENRLHLLGAFSSSSTGTSTESGAGPATVASAPRLIPSAVFHEPEVPSVEPSPTPAIASLPASAHVPAAAPRIIMQTTPTATTATAAPPSAPLPSASAEPAKSMDEAELVLDGLRALRKEGDPARARALFSQYLAKHPNGALADDALGYQMEAADRAGSPDAARLANAYLAARPAGRYVSLATRLREKSSDR